MKTFIWIFGIFALIDGLVNVIRAIVLASRKQKWGWPHAWGLLGFLIGAIILAHPDYALGIVVVLVGIWAVIMGVAELAIAFDMPPQTGRGIVGVLGALSIIIGIIILIYPVGSVYALMVLIGIYALMAGVFDFIIAFYVRGLEKKVKKEIKAA